MALCTRVLVDAVFVHFSVHLSRRDVRKKV